MNPLMGLLVSFDKNIVQVCVYMVIMYAEWRLNVIHSNVIFQPTLAVCQPLHTLTLSDAPAAETLRRVHGKWTLLWPLACCNGDDSNRSLSP